MTRSTFRSYVAIMRFSVRDDLQQGAECACSKTAATCRELQAGETHLWTFVRVEGIEPTNNEAGQSLRHAVLYRKTSGGNDSKLGSRFAEQILTVVATCRQQKLNVLENLTRCYQAHLDGQPAPPLLPASSIADHAAGSGFKVHPAEARGGLNEGGHADSIWSCVKRLQIRRSACPPACCITPLVSGAMSTFAPSIGVAK